MTSVNSPVSPSSQLDIKNLHLSLSHKFYDKHTLYIDTGAIPKDKLESIISDGINAVIKKLKTQNISIDSDYRFNLVENRDYQSLGYAYLWVSDERLYNICNGLNPDGTRRIRIIPNPKYNPRNLATPTPPSNERATPISMSGKWADIEEEEEQFSEPATIEVQLEPLITFAAHEYTETEKMDAARIIKYSLNKKAYNLFSENISFEEQKTDDDKWKFYEGFLSRNKGEGYTEWQYYTTVIFILSDPEYYGVQLDQFFDLFDEFVDEIKVDLSPPDLYTIGISGAYVISPPEDEKKSELFALIHKTCKVIPTADQIRARFLPFISNKKSKYPIVQINQPPSKFGGNIRVIFDEKTRDAQFILYFFRKLEFQNPKCLFLFNLAKTEQKKRY